MNNWYVVKTQKGYEKKVRETLSSNIKMKNLDNLITQVIYPSYIEIIEKNGKIRETEKALFPGFIAIKGEITDEVWFVIRNTSGVFGLLGSSGGGTKPIPLTPIEYKRMLSKIGKRVYKNENVEIGQEVTILKDILKDQKGKIISIDHKNHEVKIEVNNKKLVVKMGEIKV